MHDAFFALFCTVDQPASYINGLIQHAEEHSSEAGNIFCLLESPDQKRVDKPTGPEVSDFKTGFTGWSVEQLGNFCKEKFSWRDNPKSQPPYISEDIFAVLDERTLRDGTVLLAWYSYWKERIDPDDPNDGDEAFKHNEGYRTIRSMRNSTADHLHIMPEFEVDWVLEELKPEDDGVWRSPNWEKEP